MRKSAYSPVLDRTVQSSPIIPKTGLDCGLGVPDCAVRSFLQSLFPSDKKTGLYGPVSLKLNQTAVWGCWTVWSSLFQWSTNKATVRTRLDQTVGPYFGPVLKFGTDYLQISPVQSSPVSLMPDHTVWSFLSVSISNLRPDHFFPDWAIFFGPDYSLGILDHSQSIIWLL
jgi:hypothetical protein